MFKTITALLGREPEPIDFPFVDSDVAQLERVNPVPGAAPLDTQTWKDMLVSPFLQRLSACTSIFGQQVLYQRLRGGLEGPARAASLVRVRALLADPEQADALQQSLVCLRSVDREVASLLFEEQLPARPFWAGRAWLLFGAVVACSAAALWFDPVFWLGVLGAVVLLMATQMRYHERVEHWQRGVRALNMLLRASSLLAVGGGALAAPFVPYGSAAGALNRTLSQSVAADLVPGMREYLNWFALHNVECYFKTVALVERERAFLRACYERCANLEADLALARYLRAQPLYCEAQAAQPRAMVLGDAIHPLLSEAQPLSLALDGMGAFISGQNGIGKSTLLRTVGINLVMARAFGFCLARQASVPHLPIYASMQGEDALLGGESLYMAELRRAQELLAAAAGAAPGVVIIDEIFRGTNHLESVSAAAAVVDALAEQGLVLVSSHNLVLASLLAHRLQPFCVEKQAQGALVLRPGVLEHTNGIALLAQRGLGQRIETNAGKVFDWLSSYLAHPNEGADLLDPRRACAPVSMRA